MRAALILSGYSRGFELNIEYFERSIIKSFDHLDCYIHLSRDEIRDDKYMNSNDFTGIIEKNISSFNPKSLIIDSNIFFSPDKSTNDLFNNWANFYKLNEIRKIYSDEKYDIVIKARPDLRFISEDIFSNVTVERGKIYIPRSSKIDKSKLINISDPYLCDSFAFGGEPEMNLYFKIYQDLSNLVKKFGNIPETVMYHHLRNSGLDVVELDIDYEIVLSKLNVFGISGDSGSGKTTLANYLKSFFCNSFTLECDRYHKWERGDSNWEKFTHLNPEANYISKMQEDVFSLKLGKCVFQVDYDHKNGKFTEKKEISPAENIIVCGLHSLYGSDQKIYDLKIFVDTDDSLKIKWKIERDVVERGYDKDHVMSIIEKRRFDYLKFILPQMKDSDVIIRFYQNPNTSEISLKILINNCYSIENILGKLSKNNIPFEVSSNEVLDFTEINFSKFVDINLWDDSINPRFHNFYDYIIYIILRMHRNDRNL